MEGVWNGRPVRLGRRDWVGGGTGSEEPAFPEIWLRVGGEAAAVFRFEDALRADAADAVQALKTLGLDVMLVSGDHDPCVAAAARRAGIQAWRGSALPTSKAELLAELAREGKTVLMVGDGINDAPALASAAVSMSPASAADISQTAAGIVFTGRRLDPVVTAIRTARAARRTILQNFALAIGYNLFAVPIAMAGLATPLIAAAAMSTSSIIVTGNALRLPLALRLRRADPVPAPELKEAIA
jgi:Cu2+-exporting ATPase